MPPTTRGTRTRFLVTDWKATLEIFRHIFFVAALAGLISGVFVTVAHEIGTVPIILKAENYEKAAEQAAVPSANAMPGMSHDDEANAWEPADGLERMAFTVLADVLTGIGFAVLLVSAYALRGDDVDWHEGLYWGLAGFATFTLAPGLGLPPQVPGTEAAPLVDRQIWWVTTAVATGGGLAVLFFTRRAVWAVAGVVLLVLPHILGAPQPAEFKSVAPALVAHQFIVATVVTSLLFWIALGSLTGFFYKQFRPSS